MLCESCKKVEIGEPRYCCGGWMCGCYGKPIDPPFCETCYDKILGKDRMNQNQIECMEHAIKNQNRFYDEADDRDWNELVDKGYATKRTGWEEDMAYFCPTEEGMRVLKELQFYS